VSRSNIDDGWLIGGCIEYGFKPNWTVKLEYDYAVKLDFGHGSRRDIEPRHYAKMKIVAFSQN
jgi:opacity protein-like surface antigen